MLLACLLSTLMELFASPLYAESLSLLLPYLFFIFQRNVHRHLFLLEANRGPNLLREQEVFPRQKYFIYTSNNNC